MTIIADPDAEARSLMNRAPCICDGEKTGIQCKHFWSVIQKFDAANADTMRRGESNRACTLMAGWPLEFVSEEKPVYCRRYEPRKEEGLFALIQRAVLGAAFLGPSAGQRRGLERVPRVRGLPSKKGTGGYVRYDEYFNEFNPMTQPEIEQLRRENPDQPGRFGRGKNPLSMTVDDIAANPVNMLKPGEAMPGGLSPEVDRALDDLFDPKNPPKKDTE